MFGLLLLLMNTMVWQCNTSGFWILLWLQSTLNQPSISEEDSGISIYKHQGIKSTHQHQTTWTSLQSCENDVYLLSLNKQGCITVRGTETQKLSWNWIKLQGVSLSVTYLSQRGSVGKNQKVQALHFCWYWDKNRKSTRGILTSAHFPKSGRLKSLPLFGKWAEVW